MNSEIKFLRTGEAKKDIEKINEVLEILKKKIVNKDILAGKRLLFALIRASLKEEAVIPIEMPKPVRVMPKVVPIKVSKPKIMPKAPAPPIVFSKLYPLIIYKNPKGEILASSRIRKEDDNLIYEVNEPEINKELLAEVKKLITGSFSRDKTVVTDNRFLMEKIKKASKKLKLGYDEKMLDATKYYLQRDLIGFGKIDILLFDANIKKIICDGINIPVKIIFSPAMEMRTNIIFDDEKELDGLINNFAARLKKEIKQNIIEGEMPLIIKENIVNFKIEATFGFAGISSKFMLSRLS